MIFKKRRDIKLKRSKNKSEGKQEIVKMKHKKMERQKYIMIHLGNCFQFFKSEFELSSYIYPSEIKQEIFSDLFHLGHIWCSQPTVFASPLQHAYVCIHMCAYICVCMCVRVFVLENASISISIFMSVLSSAHSPGYSSCLTLLIKTTEYHLQAQLPPSI